MASATVVPIADGTAIVTTQDETDGIEVTQEWLESLFAAIRGSLGEVSHTLTVLAQAQQETTDQLVSLRNQLPENLTQMIQSQQETITALIAEQMATVRALLTPPAVTPEPEPVPENVVVESPVARTEPVAPRQRRFRPI